MGVAAEAEQDVIRGRDLSRKTPGYSRKRSSSRTTAREDKENVDPSLSQETDVAEKRRLRRSTRRKRPQPLAERDHVGEGGDTGSSSSDESETSSEEAASSEEESDDEVQGQSGGRRRRQVKRGSRPGTGRARKKTKTAESHGVSV